jgi:hypothetical protein
MNIPLSIRNLANTDRKLLETVLDLGFDTKSIVTKSPAAHPAQHSLMSFLIWFGQPHIKEATDILLSLFNRVEHLAAKAQSVRARVTLEKALHLIDSITPASLPDQPDPVEAAKARREAHALARESRLIATRLTPSHLLKDPDAPRRTPRRAASTASSNHHTNAQSHASSSSALSLQNHTSQLRTNDSPQTQDLDSTPHLPAPAPDHHLDLGLDLDLGPTLTNLLAQQPQTTAESP